MSVILNGQKITKSFLMKRDNCIADIDTYTGEIKMLPV